MKVVVTGASGFVGQMIVPRMERMGWELLLVGRDPARLDAIFPGRQTCSYQELEKRGAGADLLIHLAVLNNDNTAATRKQYVEVNVDFALSVLASAKSAGIRRFAYASSFHALGGHRSDYSESKRQAACKLADEAAPGQLLLLYLPSVHGERWTGRLSFLNRLPPRLASMAFTLLAALGPTVSADRIVESLAATDFASAQKTLLVYDDVENNPLYRLASRSIDLAFVFVIVAFFWWLLILLWLWIRLDSRGPALFAQRRVGRNGSEFTCWKFRTMAVGTQQVATHEAPVAAITGAGGVLRRLKLDELPQIWNVLRGEMSLVGPRPGLPSQVELAAERRKRGVLSVRPGITGLSQIDGIDMRDPVRLARRDAEYLALRGILLDLRILVATLLGRGGGDRTAPRVGG